MRIIMVSVPKCGTNLLAQMLNSPSHIQVPAFLVFGDPGAALSARDRRERRLEAVAMVAKRIKMARWISFGHIPHNVAYAGALEAMPTKILLLVRDQRDRVISHYFWIKRRPEAKMNTVMADGKTILEQPDPISALIELEPRLWNRFWGWLSDPRVLTVRFEDLIERPVDTCRSIFKHVGIDAHNMIAPDIRTMLGRVSREHSPTFREGRVGGWRAHVTDAHIEQLKDLDPLVEGLGYDVTG